MIEAVSGFDPMALEVLPEGRFADLDAEPFADDAAVLAYLDGTAGAVMSLAARRLDPAARFQEVAWVTAGTTLGMMIANTPAVLVGDAAATRLPLKLIRLLAAAAFAAVGVWILIAG